MSDWAERHAYWRVRNFRTNGQGLTNPIEWKREVEGMRTGKYHTVIKKKYFYSGAETNIIRLIFVIFKIFSNTCIQRKMPEWHRVWSRLEVLGQNIFALLCVRFETILDFSTEREASFLANEVWVLSAAQPMSEFCVPDTSMYCMGSYSSARGDTGKTRRCDVVECVAYLRVWISGQTGRHEFR